MNDSKGGIRNAAHRTDGKRCRNGRDAVLELHILRHHGGDYLRGQGRENARLYPAAETVRKHDDRRIITLLHYVDMIAAQLLAVVIYTLIAYFRTQIIHR